MFYSIYVYHRCSLNGTYCCSGYLWNEIQKTCVRKCCYINDIWYILNRKFKNSSFWPNIYMTIFIACKAGYTGINCDTKCIYPLYGNDCQSMCNCTNEDCDHMDGCRNSSRKTIENICSGYVVRIYIKINFWFIICEHLLSITTIYIVTEVKMELSVVMDTCGIKKRQHAYVRKLTLL